jgi:hypothetical protein
VKALLPPHHPLTAAAAPAAGCRPASAEAGLEGKGAHGSAGARHCVVNTRAGANASAAESENHPSLALRQFLSPSSLGRGGRVGVNMRALLIGSAALAISGCKTLTDYEQDPVPGGPGTGGTVPVVDCSAYEFNGNTYDCSTLDLCDASQESIPTRLACCSCDPNFCNPPTDGSCQDPDYCTEYPDDPKCDETNVINTEPAEGCMECHNGSQFNDYAGTGIENPHWTDNPAAQYLTCTTCHGGNGEASGRDQAHVPRPPAIADDNILFNNPESYFNYLTLTGVDKYFDYIVNGVIYIVKDWI